MRAVETLTSLLCLTDQQPDAKRRSSNSISIGGAHIAAQEIMCGIGLIVSGVAIQGYVFSSETASSGASSQPAAPQVAEPVHPSIEDLSSALKRRGPDHIGGATLHVGPLKQHLEIWEHTHLGTAVNGGSRDDHTSEDVTRCKENEADNQEKGCAVPSSKSEAAQPELTDSSSSARLHFVGATLQLRGEHPVTQPLEDSAGNVLVYNGEVFGGLMVRGNENDTAILMATLHGCCGCTCHSGRQVFECQCPDVEHHQTVPQVLSRLRGPWALIYWQAVSQTLWFGRDAFGRRSLLIHQSSPADPRLLLTSVAPDLREVTAGSLRYWEELACGIYSVAYSAMDEGETRDSLTGGSNASSLEDKPHQGSRQEGLMGWARAHSWQDPWLRTLIAWKRQHVTPSKICSLESSQSDQVNDTQENPKLLACKEGQKTNNYPLSQSACQNDARGECALNDTICQEQRTEGRKTPVEQVLSALRVAVKRRTTDIQRHWGSSQWDTYKATRVEFNSALKAAAPIAVLFSGGVDSMILAALAHEFIDSDCSIDLLNVSFDGNSAPDRITAVAGVAELREVFPSRSWRLIEIDAELADLADCRVHLQSLICPSETYMDLNIGTALWLAASGKGRVRRALSSDAATVKNGFTKDDVPSESYGQKSEILATYDPEASDEREKSAPNIAREKRQVTSVARVLLVGSGADEQCGGYGRHRTKFRLGGWKSLEEEMRLDFNRIWKRNLGRDDRCIADQGKEARFPFLDEDVVSTLLSLSLWDVVDLRQPSGIGDKKILRQVAQVLGLKSAALLPKRAIQFGSRIAQESNRKDFGSNRAANQASAGSALLKVEQPT